ncbi:MAG TPA: hypothetical protein VN914_15805, partial [Polyangia bacterium]|nr:hypothetical protein [Polyangia bacterium]
MLLFASIAACGPDGAKSPMMMTPPPPDLATSPTGCDDDSACSGATPRCEVASRQCVECLPQDDNCVGGAFCSAANKCVTACAVDGDCPGAGLACCGGLCADLTSDPGNCGMCGQPCSGACV